MQIAAIPRTGAGAPGCEAPVRAAVSAVLIGTYDLGRQPFGLASPAAWLRRAGASVRCLDLSRQALDASAIAAAHLVAFHVPMHTATRLALQVLPRVRELNPTAVVCFYGLYAPTNEPYLRALGVDAVIGGEFEEELARLAVDLADGDGVTPRTVVRFDRLNFLVPEREGLPALGEYAAVAVGDERRVAGATETTRGCKHRCRHCPVVPVYDGRLRLIQQEIVLADVDAQVAAGAEHITFADPDFFNAWRHSIAVVEEMYQRHPGLTYDVTIKIEHVLKHPEHLARLRETGCLWITSAVESVDDEVLRLLDKGHTRADFVTAVHLLRSLDMTLSPTFVMFHPWLSGSRFIDTLALLQELELVDAVAPVQLSTRLLIPSGSRLLELPEVHRLVGPFDADALAHPWRHPDPSVDHLHVTVQDLVADGEQRGQSREEIFDRVWEAALRAHARRARGHTTARPHVTEPWYC